MAVANPTPRVVIFDLDGTLCDSAPGILAALRHAFAVNGLPTMDEVTGRALLGPPFYESLPPLIGAERLPDVIGAYREYYGHGAMFDVTAFPGVTDLLAALRRHRVRLAVATSKAEHYAGPILEHLGMARYFETIGGDELDGSLGSKALVIGKVLSRLGGPAPDSVVMVGDRSHDVLGAREHGIACIAVTWGYAVAGELVAAEPVQICASPGEVASRLGVRIDAEAS